MTKKILSILIITFSLLGLFNDNSFANEKEKTYFRVTAYYSPLPNQTHYIKGNYIAEKIMNGEGIRGASGKKVFSGMLAAPSKYSFGTKIKLKGLGIAEVADRGGAIVKAGERNFKYDRIDIWCGYGEEGLQRAMFWGNRVIEGEVVSRKSKVNLKLSSIPAPRWTIYHATKNPDFLQEGTIKNKIYLSGKKGTNTKSPIIPFYKRDNNKIFDGPIQNSDSVKKLQKILTEMKLYSGDINGKYLNIRNIILDFQLKNNVITKKTDIGAGNFGPKTRKTLKQKYSDFKENIKKEKEAKIKRENEEKKKLIKAEKRINSIGKIKFGDISNDVRMCQKALREVGFFRYKDTAIFGEKTKQSIIDYQLDRKLISNKNIYGAGIFGPKTRKSLIKDLSEIK